MPRHLTKTLAAFALLFALAMNSQASADVYGHIDRLAVQIRNKARLIVNETKHYRNTPEYNHLLTDAIAMRDLAEHIHDVTHFEGNLAHLESDLRELDASFHHIENLIAEIERHSYYGCRIVRGRTAHVKRLLASIEDSIHHLQEDVATLRRPPLPVCPSARPGTFHPPRPVIHPPYRPVYGHGHGARTYGGSGFSFSIGGGNSRVSFRF